MRRFGTGYWISGLGLAVFLAAAVVIRAQDGPPPGPPGGMGPAASINVKKYEAERELARLTKRYKLTEEEKAGIRPVLLSQQAEVHKLGEETELSDAQWVAEVRQVHQQTVIKVKLLMTDAQATRYIEDEKKQAKNDAADDGGMDGLPNGPPPGGGGPPM